MILGGYAPDYETREEAADCLGRVNEQLVIGIVRFDEHARLHFDNEHAEALKDLGCIDTGVGLRSWGLVEEPDTNNTGGGQAKVCNLCMVLSMRLS